MCSFIILNLTGCGNKYKGQGTEPLKEHGDVALHIDSGNKGNCVKVTLVLYEDNQYELFTDYKECRPWQTCTEELRYTKSIKGTYNYDDNANVQLRVRSSHSPAVDKTQIRLSPGFKCNVAEKTTLYANPYLSANIDYRKEQCSLDYGFFAGVTQGIGKKVKISAEVQRYSNHWGANVITSINF